MNEGTIDWLAEFIDRRVLSRKEIAFLLWMASSAEAKRSERLLEEADRAPAVTELPTRHARVHAMGHTAYVGPVTALSRGYRVEHHEVAGDEGAKAVTCSPVDILAVHSVEYLTPDKWARELAELEKLAARDNEYHRRTTTMPEGYSHVLVDGRHGYRCPDGVEKTDWGWGAREAHSAAWRDKAHRENLTTAAENLAATAVSDPDEDDIPSDATAEAPAADVMQRLEQLGPEGRRAVVDAVNTARPRCADLVAGDLTCGNDGCPKCYPEGSALRAYLTALYTGPGDDDDAWRERLDDLRRAMTVGEVAAAEEHLARGRVL